LSQTGALRLQYMKVGWNSYLELIAADSFGIHRRLLIYGGDLH
jgi:hypothetical protein